MTSPIERINLHHFASLRITLHHMHQINTHTITRHLRCILTEKELLEVSKQSAELTRAIVALEDDKGRISKDFTARIAEKEAARSVLTDKVLSGYEFRNVPCTVRLNDPKPGVKTVIRDDTLEEVAIEQMLPDELQEELPLDPEPPTAEPNTNLDDEVDETAREALIKDRTNSESFKNALESANLGTLNSVKAHLIDQGIGGKRRSLVWEQLAKLEAAATQPAAPSPAGWIWDADGTCQNPTNLVVTGPGMVKFAIFAAQVDETGDQLWRRGFSIQDIEPEADMMCDRYGYGFETAREAFAGALEDVLAHFDKGRAHGVKEYAVTYRRLDTKAVYDQILDAAVAAVESGQSATLELKAS